MNITNHGQIFTKIFPQNGEMLPHPEPIIKKAETNRWTGNSLFD
jgi:hypothetical protein